MGKLLPHSGPERCRTVGRTCLAVGAALVWFGCAADPAVQRAAEAELQSAIAQLVGGFDANVYRDPAGPADAAAADPLRRYYAAEDHRPIWIGPGGLNERGRTLVDRLARSDDDALDPATFGVEAAREALATGAAADMAAAEIRLSRSLLHYAGEFAGQRRDDLDLLRRAAAAADFGTWLDDLPPRWPAYRRLRDALARYRAIDRNGGWPTLAAGPLLKPGAEDARVPALRRRLAATGDLEPGRIDADERYDTKVAMAVGRFQARHGLAPDGVLGDRTLAALNRPVGARIGQIEDGLRTLRGFDLRFAELGILVNIAAAELSLFERGEPILDSRTIIGRPDWPTPALDSWITAVDLNPAWFVPERIALEEILPRAIDRGPEYLERRGFRLFDRRWRELDAAKVDWAALDGKRLPFLLRQDPGPQNQLGQVKFVFANPHDVYLHGTPNRRLFARTERTLSHGCIRVEQADELALFLLGREGWNDDTYRAALDAGRTVRVRLADPVPVQLISLPAWVDREGRLQFRDDPYAQSIRLAAIGSVRPRWFDARDGTRAWIAIVP